jgi:hypothetical protein
LTLRGVDLWTRNAEPNLLSSVRNHPVAAEFQLEAAGGGSTDFWHCATIRMAGVKCRSETFQVSVLAMVPGGGGAADGDSSWVNEAFTAIQKGKASPPCRKTISFDRHFALSSTRPETFVLVFPGPIAIMDVINRDIRMKKHW